MSFASLLAAGNKHMARIVSDTQVATVRAWFPVTATTAPTTRATFSVEVDDVLTGPARRSRDPLSGLILEKNNTLRISFAAAGLTYTPTEGETLLLYGTTRAAATLYRVTVAEAAAGLLELEIREDTHYLA